MAVDELGETREGKLPEEIVSYVASAEARERAERARKEMELRGWQVSVKLSWWKYEIFLNDEAAAAAAEAAEVIGDIVGSAMPSPFGEIAEAYAKLRAAWIRSVANGAGCKLVSPWFAPGALIPVRVGVPEDRNLWWTVFDDEQEGANGPWGEDEKFTGHKSRSNPNMAILNGKLLCTHQGSGDNHAWFTVYTPEAGWSEDRLMFADGTSEGLAVATYNGTVHAVFQEEGGRRIKHSTYIESQGTWTTPVHLPAHQTVRAPALAVFQGKLHMVHRGNNDNDYNLWHATFDGANWSGDTQLPAHKSASYPALAEYGGRLHMVHRGGANDVNLYHATFDGSSWSHDNVLSDHRSREGVGLAVFKADLYCVHRGNATDHSLWWTSYRTSWSPDQKLPNHMSGAGPAAIVYKDKNGIKDQLMVVHRGGDNRAAVAETAESDAPLTVEHETTEPEPTP